MSRAEYDAKEKKHWEELQFLTKDIPFDEMMKNWPAFIRRRELPRLLAHYELFKQIIDLPGSIVELGVYLGAGFFTWSKLLETFVPGDRSRRVYGFDDFRGYTKFSPEDGDPSPWIKNIIGPKVASEDYTRRMIKLHNDDNMLPGVTRCEIWAGNIRLTVPEFARESQGIRLSMLYFDVNLYEPTLVGLEWLYPLVLPGGLVVFNGYGGRPWQGEAEAIKQYFAPVPVMKKFPWSTHPSAYFVKS